MAKSVYSIYSDLIYTFANKSLLMKSNDFYPESKHILYLHMRELIYIDFAHAKFRPPIQQLKDSSLKMFKILKE